MLFFAALMPCSLALFHKQIATDATRQSSACFTLNMIGFGPRSPRVGVRTKEPLPEEQVPVAAGELPDDAFSQYPPLSTQQLATLKRAEDIDLGHGETIPAEVCDIHSEPVQYTTDISSVQYRQRSRQQFSTDIEITVHTTHRDRSSRYIRHSPRIHTCTACRGKPGQSTGVHFVKHLRVTNLLGRSDVVGNMTLSQSSTVFQLHSHRIPFGISISTFDRAW